jgi:hypothetical protein
LLQALDCPFQSFNSLLRFRRLTFCRAAIYSCIPQASELQTDEAWEVKAIRHVKYTDIYLSVLLALPETRELFFQLALVRFKFMLSVSQGIT